MAIKRKEENEVGAVDSAVAEAVEGIVETNDIEEQAAVEEQAVAVIQDKAVAVARPHVEAKPNVINELAESGYEGLAVDFTSFDTITLEKSAFACSSGKKIKEDFEVQILSTRNKFLITSLHANDDDREAVYSYNKNAVAEDPSVMARVKAWQDEDGVGCQVKTYIEAAVLMENDQATGELNGEMMLLQIPPASIGKLTGHIVQNRFKGNGEPKDYTTVVYVGPKTGEGQKAFYPWAFKIKK